MGALGEMHCNGSIQPKTLIRFDSMLEVAQAAELGHWHCFAVRSGREAPICIAIPVEAPFG